MHSEFQARRELAKASRHLYRSGLVRAFEGNLSLRLQDAQGQAGFLVTPSRRCKGELQPHDMVLLDDQGRTQGSGRVSTELPLHLGIYRQLPQAQAVVHAHAPYSTAHACTTGGLDQLLQPELLLLLGSAPPLAPYASPGSPALFEQLKDLLAQSPVLLLERHGVVAVSTESVMDAVYLLEQVEAVARIQWLARQLPGTLPSLEPEEQMRLVRGRPIS